jgi:hypothetical protein
LTTIAFKGLFSTCVNKVAVFAAKFAGILLLAKVVYICNNGIVIQFLNFISKINRGQGNSTLFSTNNIYEKAFI